MRLTKSLALFIIISTFFFQGSSLIKASDIPTGEVRKMLYPGFTQTPPRIDGVLDDPVWQTPPIVTEPFILNEPIYGDPIPQKTYVWFTYDHNNIYAAFYCFEDPGKIKTSISRRDNLGKDDFVGLDLDSNGNRQFTYEHYSNANGTQLDLINSASGGENIEPDWVWYSAGKIVKDGYIVEMQIPLKSIKFKSGKNVIMNVAFYRKIGQTGGIASWPKIGQEKGYFNSLFPAFFEKLNSQLRLEALPSLTYGNIQDRLSPTQWSKASSSTQFGLGIKYGITSSINSEITINPDFSQVESDEFQVLANQRYPVFYSEKRPFFLEIQSQFDLAGIKGVSNMSTAVHTRNIVDPAWGAKITGDYGRISAGIVAAGDKWQSEDKNANILLGRLKYSLKGENYMGLIFTGRKHREDSNYVIGSDLLLRFKNSHYLGMNGLYSSSKNPYTLENTNGGSFLLTYDNLQKKRDFIFCFEHVDRDFRMDSAFYYRTGITSVQGSYAPSIYPDKNKLPWLLKIRNQFVFGYTYDHVSRMDDSFFLHNLSFRFPHQTILLFRQQHYKEAWMEKSFNQNFFQVQVQSQLAKWIYINTLFRTGKSLYYSGPFTGHKLTYSFQAQIQPSWKFTQDFTYEYERFTRNSDNQKIYDLNLFLSRTTYQFNKYFFIRALVQLDSYEKKILTDILGSFTLIPGTVLHIGYGSLYNKQSWDKDSYSKLMQSTQPGKYYQMTRSFFLKASYLFRF